MGNNPYYAAYEFWGGIVLLLIALILRVTTEKKSAGHAAVWPEIAAGVLLIGDSFAFLYKGGDGDFARIFFWISNFISILAACWIIGLFFPYLNRSLPEKNRKKYMDWMMPAILLIDGACTVLLILSPFTGFLFTVDGDNLYQRGPLMGLAMILQLLLVVPYIFISLKEKVIRVALIMCGGLVVTVLQTIFYGLPMISIYCGIVGLSFFVFEILQENKKSENKTIEIIEKEETINEMQTRIALSQIKPHFLYNALNSIYVLCGKDVNDARSAITHLSDYLRSNMSSMDSKVPIAFSREMEMVEDYLAIEKIRFPEELDYSIVTPVTHFSVPALTIQPLVENAVRHGIMPLDEGGIITITTRETDQEYIVSIMDNGVGFDVASSVSGDADSEHIGIRNVRERLRRVCGGELVIRSDPGHGTEAVIRIPK